MRAPPIHRVGVLHPRVMEKTVVEEEKSTFLMENNFNETHPRLARAIWRKAEWIHGNGRFALLAPCRVLTISLHESMEAAEIVKKTIDRTGCGGFCYRSAHRIVDLEPLKRVQCNGTTKTGCQCRRPSKPGIKLCWQHERRIEHPKAA